jgi:hypothetical protein
MIDNNLCLVSIVQDKAQLDGIHRLIQRCKITKMIITSAQGYMTSHQKISHIKRNSPSPV